MSATDEPGHPGDVRAHEGRAEAWCPRCAAWEGYQMVGRPPVRGVNPGPAAICNGCGVQLPPGHRLGSCPERHQDIPQMACPYLLPCPAHGEDVGWPPEPRPLPEHQRKRFLLRASVLAQTAHDLLREAAKTIGATSPGPQQVGAPLRAINYQLCGASDDASRLAAWLLDHIDGGAEYCSHGQPKHIVNARLCKGCRPSRPGDYDYGDEDA